MASEAKETELFAPHKELEFDIDCGFLKIAKDASVSETGSKKGEIIEISGSVTPEEGFKVLIDNGIQSAPVFDEELNKFIGFLDIRQLTTQAVFGADKKNQVFDRWHLENQGITTKYLASRNAFNAVSIGRSVADVASNLGLGVHRVPVMNDYGDVENIVSQIDIVHFLADHLEELAEDTIGTVNTLGVGHSDVVTVHETSSALDAFKIMSEKKIMSIPIVDKHGAMVGQTRGHDLEIYLNNPQTLEDKSICEFLALIRESDGESHKSNAFSLFAEDDIELSAAINQLSSAKKHHLFVLDKKKRPIRIVSVGDIVRHMTRKKCWKYFESVRFGHYEIPKRKKKQNVSD